MPSMPQTLGLRTAAWLIGFTALLYSPTSWAINAKLLPEGMLRARVYQNIAQANDYYTNGTHRQSLGQAGLDKLAANGVASSSTNVYSIENTARYKLYRTDVMLDYGVNKDLTMGLWLPFLSHDTHQSTTLNQDAGWGLLGAAQQTAITGAVTSLDNTEPERAELGDIFLGFKQRIKGQNSDRFRFALGGGIRLPTGHVADPTHSQDASTGDGQWDLDFWSWTDYQFSENFFINLQTRHTYGLPSYKQATFPSDTTQSARMKFQPGLLHHIQIEPQWTVDMGKWNLLPGIMVIYDHQFEGKTQSFDTASSTYGGSMRTEAHSDWNRLMVRPMLGFQLFKMGIPAQFYLSYGHTVTGKNTAAINTAEIRLDWFFKGL
ncbi:transporter [Magnetococcus sp. PR-3]|uniref:transporter n=1 Tax=Magnetococcus sp. PR-3 TaxID=3120355 RepID=UPI002FCE3F40